MQLTPHNRIIFCTVSVGDRERQREHPDQGFSTLLELFPTVGAPEHFATHLAPGRNVTPLPFHNTLLQHWFFLL